MPSDAEAALRDIAHHIDLAAQLVGGFDYDTFHVDMRTLYAVTRCLEIISEASRRIPPEIKARHPSIPWKDIASAGNIYRHEYEDVSPRVIWDTVQVALPPLRAAITGEMDKL